MMKSSIRIANLLLDIEAVTFNFTKPYLYTFASGIKGPMYCDNRRLLSYPDKRAIVVDEVIKVVKKLRFDIMGGVATAGIPWAALIAERLHKPMIYVRPEPKGYGKKRQVEGDMKKDDRILVLDDLISTGNSAISVVSTIRENGGKVTDCVSIFTYDLEVAKKNFKKAKCNLHPLLTLSDLIEVAISRKYLYIKEKDVLLKWQKDPQKY